MIKTNNKLNNDALKSMVSNLSGHIAEYQDSVYTSTNNSSDLSELIKTERGKCNMERLYEKLEMDGNGCQ